MPKTSKPLPTKEEPAPHAQPQTPEQVGAYMGSLTDEQARQELAQMLTRQAAAKVASEEIGVVIKGRDRGLGLIFYLMADNASALIKNLMHKLSGSLAGAEADTDQIGDAWHKLTGGKGSGRFFLNLLALLAILTAGMLSRWLLLRSTRGIRQRLFTSVGPGRLEFIRRILSRLVLEIAGAVVFGIATFILFVFFFRKGDTGYELVSVYLILSYYLLLVMAAAKLIFSPEAPSLRLFPLKDPDAAFLYRWTLYIATGTAVVTGASAVFGQIEASRPIYLMFYGLGGVYVSIALMVMIWLCRKRIAETILPIEAEGGKSGPRAFLANYWHYFAIVYVLCMAMYWVSDVLMGGNVPILNLLFSLFIIPIFAALDYWGVRLLRMASGDTTAVVDLNGDEIREIPSPGGQYQVEHYAPLIRRLYRLVLFAFLFFNLLKLWGVDVPVGRIFTSHVLSIVVTVLLGFIVWEFVKAQIDSRLRQEMPAAEEDAEEGGAVGSRTGTLLLLLRKFVLTVLFVIVSLIVLSSIGVNIGPLIAGAGVAGLAIGFGAQTLVRDIISGIFFMIDDSFRVGDYVESSGLKGVVEQISLRSIKLRHPRGMVYTVPFGNLKSITNFSRDYSITKLDIRVNFDTDLEKVRKIIKKINKQLRKDEEINRVMLDDLKSQGVKEFDDSSMIVRIKFKTLPGEQFAVRKEVYRLLQEEFRASGIEFASRNVTVYMPPELRARPAEAGEPFVQTEAVGQNIRQAGAAAALASIQKEEEERAKAVAAAKQKEK